jgi:hypothetical protein
MKRSPVSAGLSLAIPAIAVSAALVACVLQAGTAPGGISSTPTATPTTTPTTTGATTAPAALTGTSVGVGTVAPPATDAPDAAVATASGGADAAAPSATGTTGTPPPAPAGGVPDQYTACNRDSDCVAVPMNSCCHNGWNVAVASSQSSAYTSSFTCRQVQMCPHYMVNDTRSAECSATRHCAMVATQDIQCGGFIASAHQCPSGYTCKKTGNPDGAGSCVSP